MQTPKTRNGSSEAPQRSSPVTPKSSRGVKMADSESDSSTSKPTPRTSTDRSPKVLLHRSPRSPVAEKKRPGKVSELESQLAKLQDDLKKAKDQLASSELCKRRAQQEAEEAKKQLSSTSARLEDSHRQLADFSLSEESRIQELRKISQERDRAWQSELEAIQKQHSADSSALTSAMNEMYRLKQQLDIAVKSDAAHLMKSESAHSELDEMKLDLAEALSNNDSLKAQLETLKKLHEEAQSQLETLKKLHEEVRHRSLESEVDQLRSALEASEIKYQEGQIQSTMQTRSAFELAESLKAESTLREAELESVLKKAKAEIFELKSAFIDKETELQNLSDMNNDMESKLTKSIAEASELKEENEKLKSEIRKKDINVSTDLELKSAEIFELKSAFIDKETELQNLSDMNNDMESKLTKSIAEASELKEENEMLKSEIRKKDINVSTDLDAAVAEVELARAAERDALMRLGCVADEADKSSRRAARVAEQLEAAQVVNSEMEAELRRLRVQTEQWRKAAEAAAAALTPVSGDGRFVGRTASSLDSEYHTVAGKLMGSPFSDEFDDESPKKKNGSVLKRIGGLLKKNPK